MPEVPRDEIKVGIADGIRGNEYILVNQIVHDDVLAV
jgi:hypothetical protein